MRGAEISVIKFFVARVLHDVIDRAIQVHGALGYSKDTPLEMFYRDARAARIYDGPDEVHRQAVAQRVLRTVGNRGKSRTSKIQCPKSAYANGHWAWTLNCGQADQMTLDKDTVGLRPVKS